jgi:uncharacterized phage infection (PIP) family protein YhgE
MGIFERFFQRNKGNNETEEGGGKVKNNAEPRSEFAQDIVDMAKKLPTSEEIKQQQEARAEELRKKIAAGTGNIGQKIKNETKGEGFEFVDVRNLRFPAHGDSDPSTSLEFRDGADNEEVIKKLEKDRERERNWVDTPYQK